MLALQLLVPAGLFAAAFCVSFLLTLNVWEFRRLTGSRQRERLKPQWLPTCRAAVIVPVKGLDDDLPANLKLLFEQDYPDYEIVFVVEATDDPAVSVIERMLAAHQGIPARLVVAGRATESGQKIHNLLTAVESLDEDVQMFAFLDADACPSRQWLKRLTYRAHRPHRGTATAYRWFVPARPTLANLLLYSVNSAVAGLMGRHRYNLVWGGSWAIRRDYFHSIELPKAWSKKLSDDLVASRQLRASKCHVEFEPSCLTASPLDMTFGAMCEFLRRQFLIGRRYVGGFWLLTLVCTAVMQIGLWSNLVAAVALAAAGAATWLIPAASALVLYALGAARAWLRQDGARKLFPQFDRQLAAARRFDIWAGPLVGLATVLAMVGSAVGNCICWRGNRYLIKKSGNIRLLNPPQSEPVAAEPRSSANAA